MQVGDVWKHLEGFGVLGGDCMHVTFNKPVWCSSVDVRRQGDVWGWGGRQRSGEWWKCVDNI